MKPIYLDYNATTPVDPAVLEAMLLHLREDFRKPSRSIALTCGSEAIHQPGR
jgi:cysteine desulfurase